MGTFSKPFTELGYKFNMKALLVIALVAAVNAESDPGFAYSVGVPHVYTHPVHYSAPLVYTHHAAPGVAPGSAVYAHVGAPAGVVPVVAAAPAAEAEEEAVVNVEKREARPEADA